MKHIKVKVYPDSKNEIFKIIKNDFFEVHLKEPAENGLANRRLLTLIEENINPRPRRMRIVSGHLSHSKIIEVEYD